MTLLSTIYFHIHINQATAKYNLKYNPFIQIVGKILRDEGDICATYIDYICCVILPMYPTFLMLSGSDFMLSNDNCMQLNDNFKYEDNSRTDLILKIK